MRELDERAIGRPCAGASERRPVHVRGNSTARCFKAVGDLWLFVRGQVPLYKSLFGEQDVKPSVITGLQFQLF